MGIDELKKDAIAMTKWQQHRFFTLIVGVIIISFFLVSVALSLYNSSGAAQLDLSKPGYQDVRQQAKRDTTTKAYPSTGPLDKEALDSFAKMYTEHTGRVMSVDTFDSAALSEESLRMLNGTHDASTTQ